MLLIFTVVTSVCEATYSRTNWVDGQAPPLSAANLNNIEQGIVDADEAALSGRYVVDATETDQGLTGNGKTVKAYVDSMGATKNGVLLFLHTGAGNTTTYTFSTSETITSNITCVINPGAILSIDSGKTLTINGPFECGLYQAFSGSGAVAFGDGAVAEVYPEWWGGDPTASSDQTAAIQAAITAADYGRVFLSQGIWYIKDLIIQGVVLGSGQKTILKAHDNPTSAMVIFENTYGTLKDVTIDGNTGGSKVAKGVIFTANGWASRLENIKFQNLGDYSVYINDCNHISLRALRLQGGTTYDIYGDKADNLLVEHCVFQSHTITNAIRLIYTGGADSGSNATIRGNWFEFDNASYKVTVPIYIAVQQVSVIDNKFNVTSDTQTAHIHLIDDTGSSNSKADETYIARNTFQNSYASAKRVVIDSGVIRSTIEWNHGIAAAADYTDNGTATLIKCMSATADEEHILGSGAPYYRVLTGSATWDPASIADGAEEAKDVTVTGVNLGDWAVAAMGLDISDLTLDAQVTAVDTVTCVLSNNTGGAVDLTSATVYIIVFDRVV